MSCNELEMWQTTCFFRDLFALNLCNRCLYDEGDKPRKCKHPTHLNRERVKGTTTQFLMIFMILVSEIIHWYKNFLS